MMNISKGNIAGQPQETKLNLVFLGEKQCGKTALIKRFLNDAPTNGMYKVIVDKSNKLIHVQNNDGAINFELHLIDTSGLERCRSTISSFIQHSTVFIVVYDVTDVESFRVTTKWVDVIRSEHGGEAIISLVGNKIEKISDRQITTKEGMEKAGDLGVSFIETSAIAGPNVTILFKDVVSKILHPVDISQYQPTDACCSIA